MYTYASSLSVVAAPVAPRSLWQEETTEEGHTYYWHTETMERSWERPAEMDAPQQPVYPLVTTAAAQPETEPAASEQGAGAEAEEESGPSEEVCVIYIRGR